MEWCWVGLLQSVQLDSDCLAVTSDVSGGWGYGAWHGSHWFQHEWSIEEVIYDISVKEWTPVNVSAAVWSSGWVGKSVTCYSDNQAVVAVLNKRSCLDKFLMHLVLRCFEARYQFVV